MTREVERHLGTDTIYWEEQDGATNKISKADIINYFGRGTFRHGRSFLEGVRTVPVGFRLADGEGGPRLTRFWSVLDGPDWQGVGEDEIGAAIRGKLEEAVQSGVGAHNRVGLLLSGGVDSTILAYILKKLGIDFVCFVVEHENVAVTHETNYARLVADRLGVHCHVVSLNRDRSEALLAEIVENTDRPLTVWTSITHLALVREALAHQCDVVLSGMGSDELFGGYSLLGKYYRLFNELAQRKGEAGAWSSLLGPASPDRTESLYLGLANPFPDQVLNQLFPGINTRAIQEEDAVAFYRELHQLYPKANISALMLQLEIELRTSEMLWPDFRAASRLEGIDAVYPFFNPNVLRAFANLPTDLKFKYDFNTPLKYYPPMYNGVDKYMLRRAYEDIIPVEVHTRARLAYTIPFAWWLADPGYREKIRNVIVESGFWRELEIDFGVIDQIFAGMASFEPNNVSQWSVPFQVWQLYQCSLWYNRR